MVHELRPDDCLIYLLRHGATGNNLANPPKLQGCAIDHGLSAEGKWQAEQVSRALAELHFAAVYSSPLRRARETAEAIAAERHLPVTVVEELTEADVGNWESRSWDEIAQSEPDAYRDFMANPAQHGYPGGENHRQVFWRVVPEILRIAEKHTGARVIVVAHNVVNRVLVSHAIGLPLEFARRVSQDNGGISVLRSGKGTLKLLTHNAVFHL